jgi:DNA modification methylase/superfamily II DNA or RNA helicase
MDYSEFLKTKQLTIKASGITVSIEQINNQLFDFQKDIVRWALAKGKAAIFAGTGLGKTGMQLEWANHIPGDVLILAPLAVSQQTVREGEKFGIKVNMARSQADVRPGINITNYEMLHKFDTSKFSGIVLDESSILKSFTGKVRNQIIDAFVFTPYKLACTATPAPNDHMELGNHAEFLGTMTRTEMLAMFFVHDGGQTSKWRLKKHATENYWQWVASWAVMLGKPSDLAYEDGDFKLPPLNIEQVTIQTGLPEANTLTERRQARKSSIDHRVAACADLVNNSDEPWIVWCGLNEESVRLAKAINGAVEITGSDKPEKKERAMLDFSNGRIQKIITKPSIAGFGMNWQHCSKMAFVGLSDSFEEYFQAVRRCWRFGQDNQVDVYVITSDAEGAVVANIKRKEDDFAAMLSGMIAATQEITKENIRSTTRDESIYVTDTVAGKDWTMHLGDCVEVARGIPSDSIHYTIFSPPFASLYTYSNSDRDMGNCKNDDEFYLHFGYLIDELFRVTMPGRLVSFHCMDIPAMKSRDGYIGVKDFPGDLIRAFEKAGWIYHSKVVIWKDPLVEATRTKALGLMHKQICKDSSMCRQGLPDYLITMRKPGDNKEKISHIDGFTTYIGEDEPGKGVYSHNVWRRYASPVWMDIRQTNTLQYKTARDNDDERHICPLQLDVIARGVELWSNPGDTVLSPFAGIGSEGYQAIKMGRKFIGIELKQSYFDVAVKNLNEAATPEPKELSLFPDWDDAANG